MTAGKIMWQAKESFIRTTAMHRFSELLKQKYKLENSSYQRIHRFSVENPADFWKEFADFSGIIFSKKAKQIVDNPQKLPGAEWFSGAKLNFAENLLKRNDNHHALIFRGEEQIKKELSYAELNVAVRKKAAALRRAGIKKGDRIAAFMPNMPETVIMMLAASALGAVWSSVSPDFGINGVLDRFSQISPKVIIAADGYFYKGKAIDTQEKLKKIIEKLPSAEIVILAEYIGTRRPDEIPNAINFEDFSDEDESLMDFEQVCFKHPLYIMYSSGTTGLPKSIVHSVGGTLIQHLKELKLHADIRKDDTVFYFTTCGWMMWNWLMSSLALGSTVVLYDGNPFYPAPDALLKMSVDLDISFFGTSAKYIAALEDAGVIPSEISDFPKLRTIASTGSPLRAESFDYVYEKWKSDVQLASISGGTDIISCFVLGNPALPVRRGEIQCKGLGMDVACYNIEGKAVKNEQGELVCKTAFPSVPVYFWNDPEGERFRNAYFEEFPGVWHHGDFISENDAGGIIIYGRSDATLNPQGVRIGTAEIYRVTETIEGIDDSVVIGLKKNNDETVALFVKLSEGKKADDALRKNIRNTIRKECSPRHVPKYITQVSDIPYTLNGKKVEIAVKKILHGIEVKNSDALANPECLTEYKNIHLQK